jgi:hypothetical protein
MLPSRFTSDVCSCFIAAENLRIIQFGRQRAMEAAGAGVAAGVIRLNEKMFVRMGSLLLFR